MTEAMAEAMTESPDQFTGQMIAQLENCIKVYCEKNASLAYDSKTTFKNGLESFEHILSHDVDIFYNSHIIRVTYYPHMPLSLSHSVLTCSVSFEKANPDRIFHPISQIFGYMKVIPARTLTIPMILTADSMRESFDFLMSAVQEAHPFIERLSYDEARNADFLESEISAAAALIKVDDKRKLLRFYYQQLLMRATHPAYEAYMVGNYALAIKKLKKFKNRTAYEDGLIEYMQKAASPRPHVPSAVYVNLTGLYQNGVPKSSFKEALFVVPAMLLFGLPWLPVFLGLYFLFYYFENKDAVYLLGVLSNAPSVMLPSMLMGILMIYFNSRIFYKLFFRKNHQKLIELENATHTTATHQFMKALSVFIAIGSVIFLFLTVHQNIKMTPDGFYDYTDFWSIQGEFYPYSEIDRLYYRAESPNGYGDMIPVPSYVIMLKNGTELDAIPLDTTDKKFISVFRSKNVAIDGP